MEMLNQCFNCWEQSIEDMVYAAIRRDLFVAVRISDEEYEQTIDQHGDSTYGLVLCEDCFCNPERIEPKKVYAFLSYRFPEYPEYPEIVSRMLTLCLGLHEGYLYVMHDDGEPIVLLEQISRKKAKKRLGAKLPKHSIAYNKHVLIPVQRKASQDDIF